MVLWGDKIDKLSEISKKEEGEKIQINKIRKEKGEVTADNTKVHKRVLRATICQ